MHPPSVRLRRATSLRGTTDGARRVNWWSLRRVLAVDSHVLLGEVARPDALIAASEPEVDDDLVLRTSHDLANALQTHAFPQHAALDHLFVVEGDGHLVLLDARRRLAQRHHDAPPVGILAVDGRLHEGGVRHAARR